MYFATKDLQFLSHSHLLAYLYFLSTTDAVQPDPNQNTPKKSPPLYKDHKHISWRQSGMATSRSNKII